MRTYRAHHRLSITIVRYVWFQLGARRPARAMLRSWGGRQLPEPRQAGRPVRAAASSTTRTPTGPAEWMPNGVRPVSKP